MSAPPLPASITADAPAARRRTGCRIPEQEGSPRSALKQLVPLLLILSLAVNVIDCVRVDQRSAGYGQVAPATRRKRRRERRGG